MSLIKKTLLAVFCFLSISLSEIEASCNAPFNPNFILIDSESAELTWIDVNGSDALGWEIELVEAGNVATGNPTTGVLLEKTHLFTGLQHSTVYTIFLRTVCDKGTTDWNGPFSFYTNIQNGDACNIDIGIEDDDCNDYFIEVADVSPSELGESIFIEEVNFIIEHSWPRDLKLELTSPSGKSVLLSAFHGNSIDNYGDPSDITCTSFASFNNEACLGIDEVDPPFVGTFKAEGDINLFLDGSDANGIWKLEICDRADDNIGSLRFVEIRFSEEVCPIPSEMVVQNIDATEVEVKWTPPFNCGFLRMEWGFEGFALGTGNSFFVNCQNGTITIPNLEPATTYEVYLRAECSQSNSPFSCAVLFTTACTAVTERESFDDYQLCEQLCVTPCLFSGNWINSSDDNHDWIVNNGPTPSSFTGPERDAFLCGNYIYIENTPSICNDGAKAILQSNCIEIPATTDACSDFSFRYHMFGLETNELRLEISEDNAESWTGIFSLRGDQGNLWQEANLDLSNYSGQQVQFRFIGISGGTEGDIALDQLEFFGANFLDDGIKYFIDNDLDGFGGTDSIIFCGNPMSNFSLLSGDCNDEESSINPAAEELPCNLIDENCNGNDDDPIQNNPVIFSVAELINESCSGIVDGMITLDISQGTLPYLVEWNNGFMGASISNLTKGVYFATITDGTGCKIQTDFIEINAESTIQIFPSESVSPSCDGIDNGMISVEVIGGAGPYDFIWDDGSTDSIGINLSGGDHYVTVTDTEGCFAVSEAIKLPTPSAINAGVQLKQDINCFKENTGSIQIGIIQGDGPFEFEWSHGPTVSFVNNLSAGTYGCTVTDINGCFEVVSDIEITQPDSISIFIEGVEDVRCHGEENGRIELSVTGGTAPYSYLWNTGSFTEDLFNLSNGNYVVTITDSKGCQIIGDTIDVLTPDPLEISIDEVLHVDCPFSDAGEINLSVTGGTPQYNYFWDQLEADTNIISGLSAGTYDLTLLDFFDCKFSPPGIEINAINLPLEVNNTIVQENLCFGDSTGVIASAVESMRWPLDYNWNSGFQNIVNTDTDSLTNLPNGIYNVTITDAEGCVGISEFLEITSPERLSYFVAQAEDLDCYDDLTGLIEIEIDGGLTPYDIQWSNGDTESLITDLPAGAYSFELLDDNDCSLSAPDIIINQPPEIIIDATVANDINGNGSGSINVEVDGGVPFYFFDWSENANTLNEQLAINLTSDTYFLSILDANSCSIDTSFFVDNVTAVSDLELSQVKIINISSIDILQITTPTTDWSYELISSDGRRVNSGILESTLSQLSTSSLPSSLYYIRISKEGSFKTLPFIIQR